MKRCGPSCRHTRNASAVFKIFVLHPKKTFATISALFGHGAMSDLSPLCAPKRTSVDHSEFMVHALVAGEDDQRPRDTKFLKFRNFACQRTQITSIPITVLPTEGRAHVTNAERDAVDAAASGEQ